MGMSNPLGAIIPVHPDMITILYLLTGPLLVLLPPHPHLEGCQACTHSHGHLSCSALGQVSTLAVISKYLLKEWVAGQISECTGSSGCVCCQALDVCRPTVHQGAPGAYTSLHLHSHPREHLTELLLAPDVPAWPLSRSHHPSWLCLKCSSFWEPFPIHPRIQNSEDLDVSFSNVGSVFYFEGILSSFCFSITEGTELFRFSCLL